MTTRNSSCFYVAEHANKSRTGSFYLATLLWNGRRRWDCVRIHWSPRTRSQAFCVPLTQHVLDTLRQVSPWGCLSVPLSWDLLVDLARQLRVDRRWMAEVRIRDTLHLCAASLLHQFLKSLRSLLTYLPTLLAWNRILNDFSLRNDFRLTSRGRPLVEILYAFDF